MSLPVKPELKPDAKPTPGIEAIPEGFAPDVEAMAASWEIPVAAAQVDSLRRFTALLLTWNASINLTGAKTADVVVNQHFPDSFCLATALLDAEAVVDVGSGGGLPALPLAVLAPGLRLRLVEPIAKKAAFLRTAVRELGLGERVTVDARRAEALAVDLSATFDAAISRAVLSPEAWTDLAIPLVRGGGRIFILASEEARPARAEVEFRSSRRYFDGRGHPRHLIELGRRFT